MNTKKYFITLFSFIIFSIYFTLSGVFVPFIASIPQSNGGFKTLSSQNDFYKMVDNFYDPDEFYNFRTDNQNINILANFYNTLNASSNFDVLTSFNQAIAVDDFNGDQRFYYNSDEFIDNSQSPTINIKAFPIYFHCLYLSTTYKQYALQVLYPEYNLLSFLFDVSPAIL